MQKLLINLLAETDAIFSPIRDWSNSSRITAVMDLRRDFHLRGLPVPKAAGGDRKRLERERDRLEKTGLVRFHRINGRRAFWKLSDSTDWFLRRLCMLSDFTEAVTVMVAVDSLTDMHHTNGEIVPDWSLALAPNENRQTAKARDKVARVAELALPALCRGWLTSWSDYRGANGYRIPDARRALGFPRE